MAVDLKTIGENIFNILKGYGYTIRMYDESGSKVINPGEATRFFITDNNVIIHATVEEIKVHLGKEIDFSDVKDTIDTIKHLAKKYMIDFNIKKFGHRLEPKDYIFDLDKEADQLEKAVQDVLDEGLRTKDIISSGMKEVSTSEMGAAIISKLQ